MPKRKIDPATGEPRLTHREQRLVDEFIKNGGNGAKPTASAGYGNSFPGSRPRTQDSQLPVQPAGAT